MESSILSEVDDTSILRTGSPRRYGCPLNWLPTSRLLPRAAGWSAATLCHGTLLTGWHLAVQVRFRGVVPPFAERTLATTECFDFGDQCTVLPTRNGDYGRSREVAPATAGERWVICRSRAHRQRCCGSAPARPNPGSL